MFHNVGLKTYPNNIPKKPYRIFQRSKIQNLFPATSSSCDSPAMFFLLSTRVLFGLLKRIPIEFLWFHEKTTAFGHVIDRIVLRNGYKK